MSVWSDVSNVAMDIPTSAEIIDLIERFLERHDNMAPTRFGRESTGDPNLIADLRRGVSPKLDRLHRISEFMARKDADLNHAVADSGAAAALSPDTQSEHIGQQASGVAA